MIAVLLLLLFVVSGVNAQFIDLRRSSSRAPSNYRYYSPVAFVTTPVGSVISVGGKLYGTTSSRGVGFGSIFSINTDGTGLTSLMEFSFGDGQYPIGGLVSDGSFLYGTTAENRGTIFRMMLDGSGFTTLHYFSGGDGELPTSALILDGTTLYGATRNGGANGQGVLFRINTDGSGFTELYHFDATSGGRPFGDLYFDGTSLYGFTSNGGSANVGVAYRIAADGTGFTSIHDLSYTSGFRGGQSITDGNMGGFVSDGTYLYATVNLGGSFGWGNIFKVKPDGSGYAVVFDFANYELHGFRPTGSLVYDGTFLYGTTTDGLAFASGTPLPSGRLFKVKPDGTGFTSILDFAVENDGDAPGSNLLLNGTTLYGFSGWSPGQMSAAWNTDGSLIKIETDGSGYATLYSYSGTAEGYALKDGLLQVGSSLYGSSGRGGSRAKGNIFKIDPDGGNYTLLHDFKGFPDGAYPAGVPYSDGSTLYGMTSTGGSSGLGTLYKINIDGSSYTILYEFSIAEGYSPVGSLVTVGSDLMGVTSYGGSFGAGTIFRTNADGTGYTTVFDMPGGSFLSGTLYYDGAFLYGMSQLGGTSNTGFLFKVKPDGTAYSRLIDFTGANGSSPEGNHLISDGTFLYGMTSGGGVNGLGTIFRIRPDGSSFSKLFDFDATIGARPTGGLTIVGSWLYGLTGSSSPVGSMFKIRTDGTQFTKVFDMGTCSGYSPTGSVIYDGTSFYGGSGVGLFKLNEVTVTSFLPTTGPVGTPVVLNGTNLSPFFPYGTSFNGVSATETNTPTSISTVVPAGATTGPITVKRGCITVSTSDFVVTSGSAPPTITGFTPASGPVGTVVTINGTNFSTTVASNTVLFNGTVATVTASSTTSLTTTVPPGATTGLISVTVGGNTATSTTNFIVDCVPPSPPLTTSASNCGPGTLTLGATGAANGQYRWYTLSAGGTPISGATNSDYTTPSLTATTVFYVAINDGICESTRTPVTATINNPPSAPTTSSGAGCSPGASILLTASGATNGQYRWYTTATGGTPISGATNADYSTPLLTTTTLYYVAINDGVCESTRTPVTASINNLPAAPAVTPGSGCAPGAITLAASGATNGQYRWYTVPTGGTPIGSATNADYTTPLLTTTTLYYVAINDGVCESMRTSVTATVNASPVAPTTTPGSGCAPSATITLTVAGATNGQYLWYSTSTGGTPIGGATNADYTTPSLTVTTVYYVAITDGVCESTRTPVTATINSLPATPSTTPGWGCAPSANITLVAAGATNGQYRWYTLSAGGTPLVGQTNSVFVASAVLSSTTFYVAINDGTCESARAGVLAEVRDCTPKIATTTLSVAIGTQTSVDIVSLVTTISEPVDVNSIRVVKEPLSGARATVDAGKLTIDYQDITFAGTDRLTIEACDLGARCSQQEITIEVNGELTIYNAISPNGDSRNDVLFIENITALPDTRQNKVYIFNRWGDIVFETEDYDNVVNVFRGRDKNGNELPSGTYFYKIEFAGNSKPRTGFLSLRKESQ